MEFFFLTGCWSSKHGNAPFTSKNLVPTSVIQLPNVEILTNCNDYLLSSNNNVAVFTNDCSHEQYIVTYPIPFKVYEIVAKPPLWFSTNSVNGPWIQQGTNEWVLFWKDGERPTQLDHFYLKGNVQQNQYWTTNEFYYKKYQIGTYFNQI